MIYKKVNNNYKIGIYLMMIIIIMMMHGKKEKKSNQNIPRFVYGMNPILPCRTSLFHIFLPHMAQICKILVCIGYDS